MTATDALNFSRNIPRVYVGPREAAPADLLSVFAPDRRRQYGQRKATMGCRWYCGGEVTAQELA
ncbi:hypothetical protein M8494_00835 [Serratia ureilytica]